MSRAPQNGWKRPRLGLTGRIGLALCLVALLPLAVALGPALGANRDALVDQVLRTHLVASRATTARIVAALDERRALVAALAANALIVSDPVSPESQEILRATLASDSSLLALAITDASGAEVVRVRRRGGEPLTSGDRSVKLLRDAQGDPLLALGQDLGGSLGDLHLIAEASFLTRLLEPEDLGQEATLSLLDGNGIVLAGNPDAPQPPELTQAASRRVRGATRWKVDTTLAVAAWEPVPDTDWLVLSTQPARVAERIAIAARRTTLMAGGLGLSLALLSVVLAHRSIVRPIRQILGAQRQLAGRDTAAGEGNEIRQLGQSLEALARWGEERRQLGSLFVGRYEVQELLGEGAMGAVWRAWDPRLQRAIALKTIRLDASNPDGKRAALDLLAAEAAAAAQLSHPNLVAVYDLTESPDAAFVAMELVEGRSLDRVLESRDLQRWRDILTIGAAVARALSAAHDRGLVHRDVKPGNILVGADGVAKLADFGLAAAAGGPTEDGKVFGTPGYVAPEVLLGEPATAAADIFALGALLWEALAGHHPFRARTVAKTLRATLEWSAVGLDLARPDLPPEAVSLIELCLSRDPLLRPALAAEIAHRLEQLARGGQSRDFDRRRVAR